MKMFVNDLWPQQYYLDVMKQTELKDIANFIKKQKLLMQLMRNKAK